ncbi:serine proteinase 2 [Agaricus bisporus var. bisporus H97]|uniref:serine proteinase 2 n=1 Tax=Agaricus bisporus var. bisporus (strain H97 / ATCC MYA-4626 / FGSC 10389) TaxID=936046 RepID=UPI00029F52C7|nr:serine proteinase 2 [Agaricus bisporus var. bisporus H97]EKV44726.1 serine proteinase 2 [Agaricus bisporus var. bisporus H97]
MRFSLSFAALALLVASALGAPTAIHSIETFDGETSGKHIITLKQGVKKEDLFKNLKAKVSVSHEWEVINGFAAEFDEETLNELRANPNVESITEDGLMHTMSTQTNAPWGIARLSSTTRLSNQNPSSLTFSYTFDDSAGAGVDIYVVDTGIFIEHTEFGGRATWGETFGPYADADGNGHGTHISGTAAGRQFGVAKAANLVAVKVLSDQGSGTISDIISGLNFVAQRAASTGRPAVTLLALGGGPSTVLDNAVVSLTSSGIHVVVAAGNSNADASNFSPARVPSAITVGATIISDSRTSPSNFGSVIDVFAPGQNIVSAWIDSPTSTNTLSGTSMAAAHVAGVVAYFIGLEGNVSPASMIAKIHAHSLKSALIGVPSGTLNELAHIA